MHLGARLGARSLRMHTLDRVSYSPTGLDQVVTLLVRNPSHARASAEPFVEAETSIPSEADPAILLPVRSTGSKQLCPSSAVVVADPVSPEATAAAASSSCSPSGAQYMEVSDK
jgi:hypothetical protein